MIINNLLQAKAPFISRLESYKQYLGRGIRVLTLSSGVALMSHLIAKTVFSFSLYDFIKQLPKGYHYSFRYALQRGKGASHLFSQVYNEQIEKKESPTYASKYAQLVEEGRGEEYARKYSQGYALSIGGGEPAQDAEMIGRLLGEGKSYAYAHKYLSCLLYTSPSPRD